ncbi:MAG: hypothetical protein IJW54_01080 [Clostridia bacterium]|nr:hypothetical protein [Clostridia bacterium]
MALSENDLRKYSQRLLTSKTRILIKHGFYGLLLMHMKFAIDEECETAYTDGYKIAFSPSFMDDLSDKELDFVLMHEILHVVLQHCIRGKNLQQSRYNIACDIVVNSNILASNNFDRKSITLQKHGEAMHIAPDNKEGYLYTAEEVYKMLPDDKKINPSSKGSSSMGDSDDDNQDKGSGGYGLGRAKKKLGRYKEGFDSHDKWPQLEEADALLRDVWIKRLRDAETTITILERQNGRGTIPACAKRLLNELKKPKLNWRVMLNDFVQTEINDYSFSPPDRRFSESDFFLPDFNDSDEKIENVLFMIDSSGSMSDDDITNAYSELYGAISQFDGKISGYVGFFDAAIYEPLPFYKVNDILSIKPIGGGGTDFQIVFEYVHKHMASNPPSCIIILTDGDAPYPQPSVAMGIPVLWVINNNHSTPTFGKVARLID